MGITPESKRQDKPDDRPKTAGAPAEERTDGRTSTLVSKRPPGRLPKR
jgi:hypothetical protein